MSKTSHIIHVLPKMSRITRFSCKIENFGDLTCVKHHTNSLPVNSPMQCIMVSPNLILGCQPQLSETRLAKGQLVLDKAPRPSISNVIWILSFIFKEQLVFSPLVLSARANYFLTKVQFWKTSKKQIICLWAVLSVHLPSRASFGLYFN